MHTVKEPTRGATLEVVVSRMKAVSAEFKKEANNANKSIRIVAVSATVPNLEDIALWMKNDDGSPAEMKRFGEEYRPVRLERHVIGYPHSQSPNPFAFESGLDYKYFFLN